MKFLYPYCISSLLIASALSGCKKEPLRSLQIPKESAQTAEPDQNEQTSQSAQTSVIAWSLPEKWQEEAGSGMRYATIMIPAEGEPVQLSVTPLGVAAGSVGPNVTRWAGQVGITDLSGEQMQRAVSTVTVAGQPATLVNLQGPAGADQPAQQLLAAIVPRPDRVWFFKIQDTAPRVEPLAEAFKQFILSVHFGGHVHAEESMASSNVAIPLPQSGETITYQKPQAWLEDPSKGDVRVASLIIKGEDDDANLSVTRFPGSVGGLLANINRWRGQVHLPAITTLEEQDLSDAKVGDEAAASIDLVEPTEKEHADDAKRVVVVMVSRQGMTWFFKLSGPNELLEKNKDAFAAFLHSVKFVVDSK